ncbi:hypothetical protein PFISCL1PPCAC_13320, partial [Pristionchus fissidentatus]
VHYAIFVNRSVAATHRPLFEIVCGSEVLMLLLVAFLCPFNFWIAYKAAPLHRNLRYALMFSVVQGMQGTFSRIILLCAQNF